MNGPCVSGQGARLSDELVTTGDSGRGQLAAHTGSAGGAIHEYFYILAARALAISRALVSVHVQCPHYGNLQMTSARRNQLFVLSAAHHTQHQLGKNKENV